MAGKASVRYSLADLSASPTPPAPPGSDGAGRFHGGKRLSLLRSGVRQLEVRPVREGSAAPPETGLTHFAAPRTRCNLSEVTGTWVNPVFGAADPHSQRSRLSVVSSRTEIATMLRGGMPSLGVRWR